MSVGRQEAFEIFKRDYAENDAIEENKKGLKLRYLCFVSFHGFFVQCTISLSNTLYLELLSIEQFFRSLSIDSSLIFSLYLELSLSRTNSLVPCEFEIERVHCTCLYIEIRNLSTLC